MISVLFKTGVKITLIQLLCSFYHMLYNTKKRRGLKRAPISAFTSYSTILTYLKYAPVCLIISALTLALF